MKQNFTKVARTKRNNTDEKRDIMADVDFPLGQNEIGSQWNIWMFKDISSY